MADDDVSTCRFAEFSSKWRMGFSHLRGGSENLTVVHKHHHMLRWLKTVVARNRQTGCATVPVGHREGTVMLIEKCSSAVGFGAVAMKQRWVVHISGGSVERGDLTPDIFGACVVWAA